MRTRLKLWLVALIVVGATVTFAEEYSYRSLGVEQHLQLNDTLVTIKFVDELRTDA